MKLKQPRKSPAIAIVLVLAVAAAAMAAGYLLGRKSGDKDKPAGIKVAVLGVDGAEWAVINPLIEQGKLPTFARLVKEGASGPLKSLEPILSPIIWTSIATGKTPEKHGITYFMVKDPEQSRRFPVQSGMRQCKAIWNIVTERGLTAGVIGWWASFPAERVNGFVVSDYMAFHNFNLTGKAVKIDEGKTYPPSLIKDVAPNFRDPLTMPKTDLDRFLPLTQAEYDYSVSRPFEFGNPLHHFMFSLSTANAYRDTGLQLYDRHHPDLMMVYFEQVDTVSHVFMKFAPPQMEGIEDKHYEKYQAMVENYYVYQDEILGQFLETLDKDTVVVVVSDHGFKTGAKRLPETDGTEVKKAHLWHEMMGVVILWGPPVKPGVEISGAEVVDITPTVLYLLGLPAAQDMDGKVLTDAIEPGWLRSHPVDYVSSYESGLAAAPAAPVEESEVDDQVLNRLKALGYISDDMDDQIVRGGRIQAHLKKGNLAEALAEADAILAKKPNETSALLIKAQILVRMGRSEEAREIYLGLVREAEGTTDPKRRQAAAEALRELAASDHLAGRTDEAISRMLQALEFQPQDPQSEYNLAVMYESKGDYAQAIERYRRTIELNPKMALAHNNLGNCYQNQGRLDEAVAEYKRAAELDPRHLECRFNLGLLYNKQGKIEDAKTEFRAALAINPSFAPAALALAEVLSREGAHEEAVGLVEKVVQAEPANPRYRFFLARTCAQAGREEQARKEIAEARKLDPEGVDAALAQDEALRRFAAP